MCEQHRQVALWCEMEVFIFIGEQQKLRNWWSHQEVETGKTGLMYVLRCLCPVVSFVCLRSVSSCFLFPDAPIFRRTLRHRLIFVSPPIVPLHPSLPFFTQLDLMEQYPNDKGPGEQIHLDSPPATTRDTAHWRRCCFPFNTRLPDELVRGVKKPKVLLPNW